MDLTNHVFDCWNWKYLGCDESSSTYFELHTEAIKKEKVFFGVKKSLKHTLNVSILIFCIFPHSPEILQHTNNYNDIKNRIVNFSTCFIHEQMPKITFVVISECT